MTALPPVRPWWRGIRSRRPSRSTRSRGSTGLAEVANRTIDQSAAYLQGWLNRLRQDEALLMQAASQAQKAVDHIRGLTTTEAEEPTDVPRSCPQ